MVSRKLFLPPITPMVTSTGQVNTSPAVGASQSSFTNNNLTNGPRLKMNMNQQSPNVLGYAKMAAQSVANEAVRQGIDALQTKATNTITKMITPETPAGSGPASASSGFTLSRAPNPKITSLDSGVKPNTYTSDYLDAKENDCSPLHVSCGRIQIPTAAGSRLNDYFMKVTSFDLQTQAQENVSFNLFTGTTLSAANILTAFNSLLNALQVYYYYASIMTYHNNVSNNNEGMLFLRAQITPAMQESLIMLGRRLANTPCPPKMLELVRYMSANYYSSENQGSPMIKISPLPSYATLTNGVSDIDAATALLQVTASNEVYTLLRRAVPAWKINILYDVDIAPVYDSNFKSIFANLPFSYHDGTGVVSVPTVANKDTAISYNSFTNALDGVAFSLCSAYDTSSTSWVPGLISLPSNTGTTNGNTRKSYYEVSGVKGFYNVKSYPFLLRSRQESYTLNEAGLLPVSQHLFGADKCLNVNGNSITETSLNAIDYLMSLGSIKSVNGTGPNRRNSGRKGKF